MTKDKTVILSAALIAMAAIGISVGWIGQTFRPEMPAVTPVNEEMEQLLQRVANAKAISEPRSPASSSAASPSSPPSTPAQTLPPFSSESHLEPKPADPNTLELNGATLEQLTGLPGIGESKGRAILELRAKLGRFRTVEQLTEVKGIGEKTLEKLKPYIRVDISYFAFHLMETMRK